MEILWFIIGIVIGALFAWWFLSKRCKTQLEEREAELVQARRQIEQDLERERHSHQTTKERLSEAEEKQLAAEQRATSLEDEVTTIRGESDDLKSKNVAAESEHRRIEAETQQLESRLNEANREKAQLAEELKETRTSRDQKVESERSQISEYDRRIQEQGSEIDRLRAELNTARSETDGTNPSATPSAHQEETAPAYSAAIQPSSTSTVQTDDLTKIKGIGRVLEGKLHQLGITSFRQIADFTQADVERVNAVLDFPGRIEREQWVEQARAFVGDR
jgi:predicted flap endonuclease-1-like 5' DNA nuclease